MPDQRSKLEHVWWLLPAAAVGVLLYLLAPILAPFLFAALLAYICSPLVDRMARHGVPRAAVIFALLAFGQLFGFFGALLAVPASASLLVWLRHVRARCLGSGMYNA